MIDRYLEKPIIEDVLDKKMVFISGPRQIGKTTIAQKIGTKAFKNYVYLNWDNRSDRKKILSHLFPADKQLLIFDEIHKYRSWKNYLKGEYDKYKDEMHFIVTGSARLDTYRRGGDSLMGRYHFYRLHPLSLAELKNIKIEQRPFHRLNFPEVSKETKEIFTDLCTFGGFPEIYLKQTHRALRRWHNERFDRLIREDIRDMENLRDISSLQVLVELLSHRVGSLFSLNSLREDLQVTHKTVAHWVEILEKFYYHFRIYPFQSSFIKSLRKEPKLYVWDWSEIEEESIRFENLIALHLLKFCHYLYDRDGYKAQLYYLRDVDQREVDFLVCIKNKPWFSVEVKQKFRDIPSSVDYFMRKIKIPYNYLVVQEEDIDLIKDTIRIISASKFLGGLV